MLSSLVLVLVLLPALLIQTETAPGLSDAHRKWLEEEVVYIITDEEKDVFETLGTLEERERFIESFWRRRDPIPSTPENEFKDEHYARIAYANQFLGRETFTPGWRTDRGRYYIILGKPNIVQTFSGKNDLVECELWFYQGGESRGLPPFFYLLFFKRDDVGEFELYHPAMDGPLKLVRGPEFLPGSADEMAAVERLEEISTDLAHASLSFDTGEPPDYLTARPAMGVDAMLHRVEESPKRAIRTDYLDAWLRYGNKVSAEYSFNYVPSRGSFAILATADGVPIVHYALEIDPENFGLANDEDRTRYFTTLDVSVEARDAEGRLVFSNDRSDALELTPGQVGQVERFPFAYQDDFPLVPGEYTVTVILRNRALTRYTVVESELTVPDVGSSTLGLTGVMVGSETERLLSGAAPDEVRTFQLGDTRVNPAAEGLFAIGDTIRAFTQVTGNRDAANGAGTVRFELLSEDVVHDAKNAPVDSTSGAATAELATTGLAGGQYEVRARLVGTEVTRSARVTLSPRTAVPRPSLVYRRGFNTLVPGLLPLVLGDQLWNLERIEQAVRLYERAVIAGGNNLPPARWKLATAYLSQERAQEALDLLTPLEAAFPQQYEVVAGLGLAHYLLGRDEQAVTYLEKAIAIRPPDAAILTTLGDAHARLGNTERAEAFHARARELRTSPPAPR